MSVFYMRVVVTRISTIHSSNMVGLLFLFFIFSVHRLFSKRNGTSYDFCSHLASSSVYTLVFVFIATFAVWLRSVFFSVLLTDKTILAAAKRMERCARIAILGMCEYVCCEFAIYALMTFNRPLHIIFRLFHSVLGLLLFFFFSVCFFALSLSFPVSPAVSPNTTIGSMQWLCMHWIHVWTEIDREAISNR